ncbi:MAG: hypothetical protein ACLFUH_01860, partial [Bacteroidales bacterium]
RYRISGSSTVNSLYITSTSDLFAIMSYVKVDAVYENVLGNDYDYAFSIIVDNDPQILAFDNAKTRDSYKITGNRGDSYVSISLRKDIRLKIENGENASFQLLDKDSNIVKEDILDNNGEFSYKLVYTKIYVDSDGSEITTDEKTTYEPFTLKVSKAGMQDLEIPGIYATVEQEDGSRVGTLSPTVVERQMVGKNYVDRFVESELESIGVEGEIETIIVEGEVECVA